MMAMKIEKLWWPPQCILLCRVGKILYKKIQRIISKFCKKDNCIQPPIPRGKYCEQHRSCKKLRSPPPSYQNEVISQQLNNEEERLRLEEDRLLRQEQEREYNETLLLDKKKFENERLLKEQQIENERLRIDELKIKRLKVVDSEQSNNDTEYFTIKIKLPRQTLIRKFKSTSTVKDIREYLDIYFEDNKINIQNYNLVLNQSPIRKLSVNDIGVAVSTLSSYNNFLLFVDNLDA